MPEIHPSAILEGDVDLADDVVIGPGCVLNGPVRVGPGSRLIGHAYLQGPITLGENNRVYPYACLGFAPQSVKHDHDLPGEGVHIGRGNVFREGVTIHRAMTEKGPTRVGDRNYFMANSHAGHDAEVGDDCILANGTLLAGHVVLENRVVIGGNSTVHQFCIIGRGAMIGGSVGMARDLPPFFMATNTNVAGSINLVGMRRLGMSQDEIRDVRWVYATLYRRGLSLASAKAALAEQASRPIVAEYLDFIERSARGICPAHLQRSRGGAPRAATAEARLAGETP